MSALSIDNPIELNSNNKWPAKFVTKFKTLLIAFASVVIFLVIDYMLSPSAEQFGESDLLPELPLSFKTKSPAMQGSSVIAEYKQFVKPEVAEVIVAENELENNLAQHPSIEQQQKQSGLLRQLYIGNVVYRLSGIVKSTNSQNQYKAALSLTYVDIVTNQVNLPIGSADINETVEKDQQKPYVTLVQGERLNSYVVESISNRRIVFNDNGRKLWLELFIPTETSEN